MEIQNLIKKDIEEGLTFGKSNSTRFGGLLIKTIALLVPGIILGYVIDTLSYKWKEEKKFGDNLLTYVVIQTILSICVFYLLIITVTKYTFEFQNTYSGLYFVSLFFGMQTNYITNLQQLLKSLWV
jgi:hypothetical protein